MQIGRRFSQKTSIWKQKETFCARNFCQSKYFLKMQRFETKHLKMDFHLWCRILRMRYQFSPAVFPQGFWHWNLFIIASCQLIKGKSKWWWQRNSTANHCSQPAKMKIVLSCSNKLKMEIVKWENWNGIWVLFFHCCSRTAMNFPQLNLNILLLSQKTNSNVTWCIVKLINT